MNNETIVCQINKIIFYNSDNDYYILGTTYEQENLVVVGNFKRIDENQMYEFIGEFVEHSKYGIQFKAYQAKVVLPTNEESIVSFLSGPKFVGIGQKIAQAIYENYGDNEDILNCILNEPEHLYGIKGLNEKKITNMLEQIKEHNKEDGLFAFVNKYNVNYNDIISIYNRSGMNLDEFIAILQKNPYLLMSQHISFRTIDKFAYLLEIGDYDNLRAAAYIMSIIKNETFKTGSTYFDYSELEEQYLLNNSVKALMNFEELIDLLCEDLSIVKDGEHIYEYQQYDSEHFISEFINEFGVKKDTESIDEYLLNYEDEYGIVFNDEQKKAIENGINCSISIITGGPGTGKSTIVDALIKIMKKLDNRLLIGLAAPTGKASKRLSELTGEKSMTIHKLLKFDMHSNTFGHNVFNPIDYDVLIVDEVSMVDNILMASLLKASFNVKKIILLGDYNQLPSVSQGQILKDFIESESLYTTFLKQIYRQSEGSTVIELAYKVLAKEYLDNSFFNDEVVLIDYRDGYGINECLKEYIEFDNKNKIQILSPIYKGRLGIDNINKNIQSMLYGNKFDKYNIGDRVIQLKNRNDDEIYNGDIGVVIESENNTILVEFEDKIISYSKAQQIDLNLAYCISIHKSQGNEYDQVILFLPNYCSSFIDNKILYTAITRTKKKLIIISDLDSINYGVENTYHSKRKTNLKKLLSSSTN